MHSHSVGESVKFSQLSIVMHSHSVGECSAQSIIHRDAVILLVSVQFSQIFTVVHSHSVGESVQFSQFLMRMFSSVNYPSSYAIILLVRVFSSVSYLA